MERGFISLQNMPESYFLCYLDWDQKRWNGPCIYPSGDYEKDLAIIQDFYRGMKGKHIDQFNL